MFLPIVSKTGNIHVRLMVDVEESVGERIIFYMSRLRRMRTSVCSEFPGAPRGVFLRVSQNHPQMFPAPFPNARLRVCVCVPQYVLIDNAQIKFNQI